MILLVVIISIPNQLSHGRCVKASDIARLAGPTQGRPNLSVSGVTITSSHINDLERYVEFCGA
jgi:hypothetical protein